MPWGAVASAVVGGMMNKKSSGGSTTQTSEPWSGLKPYLTGKDTIEGRYDPTPLNYNSLAWAQNIAEGGTPGPAPAMFMNDQRLTGENVQLPQGPGMFPAQQEAYSPFGQMPGAAVPTPGMPQQSAVANILSGPMEYSPFGDGFGGGPYAQSYNPIYAGVDPSGLPSRSSGGSGWAGLAGSVLSGQPEAGAPMDYRDYAEMQGITLVPETNRFAPVITRVPKPPKKKKSKPRERSCFIAGTQVILVGGEVINIEDVNIGDTLHGEGRWGNTVLSLDQPELGTRKLYSINGSDPFVTSEHPFMTTNGWESFDPDATAEENDRLVVNELVLGAELVREDGTTEELVGFEANDGDADTQLYNFILSGDHTYYADGYLVHNKAGDNGGGGSSGGQGSPGDGGGRGSASGPD